MREGVGSQIFSAPLRQELHVHRPFIDRGIAIGPLGSGQIDQGNLAVKGGPLRKRELVFALGAAEGGVVKVFDDLHFKRQTLVLNGSLGRGALEQLGAGNRDDLFLSVTQLASDGKLGVADVVDVVHGLPFRHAGLVFHGIERDKQLAKHHQGDAGMNHHDAAPLLEDHDAADQEGNRSQDAHHQLPDDAEALVGDADAGVNQEAPQGGQDHQNPRAQAEDNPLLLRSPLPVPYARRPTGQGGSAPDHAGHVQEQQANPHLPPGEKRHSLQPLRIVAAGNDKERDEHT